MTEMQKRTWDEIMWAVLTGFNSVNVGTAKRIDTMKAVDRFMKETQADLFFLAQRAKEAGCFRYPCDSIVSIAYGIEPLSNQLFPSDEEDLAACERMWAELPAHRKTGDALKAMEKARASMKQSPGSAGNY